MSFFLFSLPPKSNLTEAPVGVALDSYPPVLEYISVSRINILKLTFVDKTWSTPAKPIS